MKKLIAVVAMLISCAGYADQSLDIKHVNFYVSNSTNAPLMDLQCQQVGEITIVGCPIQASNPINAGINPTNARFFDGQITDQCPLAGTQWACFYDSADGKYRYPVWFTIANLSGTAKPSIYITATPTQRIMVGGDITNVRYENK